MALQKLNVHHCFDGTTEFYQHDSRSTQTAMRFSVYIPPQAKAGKVPVLYWLSGLTCTEETFMIKAGAQRVAARLGLMLVACDTSPRKTGIAGEDKDWEVGTGAGFYLNATEAPWNKYFRMEDYVVSELPELIEANFPASNLRSIAGHSMGGHGALVLSLRHEGRYCSVSAFSPIAAPIQSPWGIKAFTTYLGTDTAKWAGYDASRLVLGAKRRLPFLIDQGAADPFLAQGKLLPEVFQKACRDADYPLNFRTREGYDHGYYFISTFIEEHLEFHATALAKTARG